MWTEIHVFRGRMYVTRQWGSTGGVRVDDGVSDRRLGQELGVPAMTPADWTIDEATVMRVAAAWSIDPTTLHLVETSARTGICGR